MKSDNLPKILLIAFAAALTLYVVSFSFIHNKRVGKGPWEAVFQTDESGNPALLVKQKKLGISQRIEFSGITLPQTNLVSPIFFSDPTQTTVPFGKVIFQDLTFLPGTVTLDLFGNEVEFLPRVLIINKIEHHWGGKDIISVTGKIEDSGSAQSRDD